MIPIAADKEGKLCTHADCSFGRKVGHLSVPPNYSADAVIWCPKCGEARCERHRKDLPTRSCCVNIVVFERRP